MTAPPVSPPDVARAAAAPERSRDRLVRETWLTWANLVTGIRVAAAMACFLTAALTGREAWNYAGLAVYWVLDVADGGIARALREETRIGAQLDILSDRLLIGTFYANYLRWHAGMAIPIGMHLLQFVVLDQYLSHQFMRWPCLSPNYFYEVDRPIWTWNWSAAGKVANGALVTGAILVGAWLGWSWIVPALVSAAVISVKVWSTIRLARLPAPEPWLAGRAGG
ncbi:MAG TPA: CDP-alcohol phosphatidyltransferase family protein [Anaeromyxobacter sp.]|nr:CDP-alcohol phosphatidyltransferase family protein [Anaeromyxobacter sp.]